MAKKRTNKHDTGKTQVYKVKTKGNKKHIKLKKAIKIFFILLVLLILIGAGVAFGIGYQIIRDAKENTVDVSIKFQNSIVKDINGKTIAVLSGDENREIISLSDMPKYLPIAFVSIEDERFYDHMGVDVKRTVGATITYILNGGSSSFGGSTITQQLIKNSTNEKEDTWKRKANEMARAYYLEKELSKDQILEAYLNLIFLGDRAHGVQVASVFYFNKSAKDLDLAECAFLAGINHYPNAYVPFGDGDTDEIHTKIKTRTKTVLNKMKELGKIDSEEEYVQAIAEVEEGLKFNKGIITQTVYSYHTDAAILEIINELRAENDWTYEAAERYVKNGGFTIYTTQDSTIQGQMEEEFKNTKYQVASRKKEGVTSQAAMVLIDQKTGYVLATVGKLGEKTDSLGLNRGTQIVKQTGSAMKPLAVLAPGIDKGIITAASVFEDAPYKFYKNYDWSFRGNMTIREATARSQNIPMVKAMAQIGPEKSMEFLKSVGISRIVDADNNLGLALGGLTYGSNPLEMAGAYAAIANDGVYIEPTFYTKIVDSNGNVIRETKQEKTTVMSAAAAYVVKEVLTEPVRSGTSTYATISGMSVAAKTGTTSDDFDRWFCGFTPYYTATVWFGYDENETVRWSGYNPSMLIWTSVMRQANKGLASKTFASTRPDGVVTATVCKETGLLANEYCKKDTEKGNRTYTEFFVKGTVPKKTCDYHKVPKNTKPVITIKGSSSVTIKVGEKYNDEGATAVDEVDGDITNEIKTSGTVNTSKSGTYTITYTVKNSLGNSATVKRTVTVKGNDSGNTTNTNKNNTNTNTNTNSNNNSNSSNTNSNTNTNTGNTNTGAV